MPVITVVEETITVGQAVVVEGTSPNQHYGAVFEDDGTTGYFYALDLSRSEQRIVEARHIYNAAQVTDRDMPSVVRIAWSADGTKTVLLINNYPHAVFDFTAKQAYCRTGFPLTSGEWAVHDGSWEENVLELFR